MFSPKPDEQLAYELSCPICLQFFSDPVVLPCGHNYCRVCICNAPGTMDTSSKMLPRCPECRMEYQGGDSLQRNFKLCAIIQTYQAAAPQLDMQPKTELKTSRLFCDHCIDDQTPAVKTCLTCDVSLCFRHLQRHQEKEVFRNHIVVEPTDDSEVRGCAIHRQALEYFCSDDMTCLCTMCFIEGHHKNHDVLTLSVAEEEMRRALETRNKLVSSRLQMTETLLQKTVEDQGPSDVTEDKVVDKAVKLMDSMAALVDRYKERLHVLLEEEQGQRRKSWQLGVTALEEQQQQLLEAQRSATEVLKETDMNVFIQRFMLIEQKLREVLTGTIPSSMVPSKALLSTKRLRASLKTQDFRSEMTHLLDSLHILLNPMDLTFNIYTAHPTLVVSKDRCTVKSSPTKQLCVEHPERFTSAPQLLCSQSFSSGEHIWLIEVGPNTMWSAGVCYKSIPRRGDHSRLGHNSVSWRLQWKNGKLTVCQSSCNVALGEITSPPIRIEIALDYEGGTLMFHSVKGRREHLHTFRVVFREPVYPAFSIHSNTQESWITLLSGV